VEEHSLLRCYDISKSASKYDLLHRRAVDDIGNKVQFKHMTFKMAFYILSFAFDCGGIREMWAVSFFFLFQSNDEVITSKLENL